MVVFWMTGIYAAILGVFALWGLMLTGVTRIHKGRQTFRQYAQMTWVSMGPQWILMIAVLTFLLVRKDDMVENCGGTAACEDASLILLLVRIAAIFIFVFVYVGTKRNEAC